MDRLKQEWKEIRIPEEVRLRARNLAWAKIQTPASGGRRALGWIAGTATVASVCFMTWIWMGRGMRVEQPELHVSQNISRPAIPANQVIMPPVELQQTVKPKPVKKRGLPKGESAPAELERIVLSFKLPESGARMIWIMDSRFHMEGDNQ
jgi:hypothetical protein